METKSAAETAGAEKTFKFKFPQLLASVPASVASAIIGSRLGVQGTLAGAAITAIVFSLVAQFATFGLERSHAGLKVVVRRRSGDEAEADTKLVTAGRPAPTRPARRNVHLGIAVAGVALTALATFGVTMGLLTAAEATSGRSVDGGYTTTVQGAAGAQPVTARTTAARSDASSLTTVQAAAPAASTPTTQSAQPTATPTDTQTPAPTTTAPQTVTPGPVATTSAPAATLTPAPAASPAPTAGVGA